MYTNYLIVMSRGIVVIAPDACSKVLNYSAPGTNAFNLNFYEFARE